MSRNKHTELRRRTVVVTSAMSPYAVTYSDYRLFVDASGGPVDIQFPTAASVVEREFEIDRIDAVPANAVTALPAGGETIGGLASLPFVPGAAAKLAADTTLPGFRALDFALPGGVAFAKWGRVAVVDDVNGSDATGAVNGAPFKTVQGAIAAVASGDQIYILPGNYDLPAAGITIPDGVAVRGISTKAVTLRILGALVATTLITMGENTRIEDVTGSLTSALHVDLKLLAWPGTTSATAKIRTTVWTVDNSTAGDIGTSDVYGVHSFGIGTPSEVVDAIRATTINVFSAGLGAKRGVLLDTAVHTFRQRDVNVNVTRTGAGAGTYYGVQTNLAGVSFDGRTGSYGGFTADISQTLGTLTVQNVNLINNNANGLGFSTVLAPATIEWADSAGFPVGTRFMREGTATVSVTEIPRRVPRLIVRRLTVRAVSPPGAARTDIWTLRKNGADTGLTVALTAAATTASNGAVSVPYSDGDTISMKVVVVAGSGTTDVIAVAELY